MLVKYHRSFMMYGKTDLPKGFFRKLKERKTITLATGVSGICDESEVETEIEKGIAKALKESGWGENFSGWQGVLTTEQIKKRYPQLSSADQYNKTTTEPINDWKMDKILKTLTAKQFAIFCKENDISLRDMA